jgi:hypothetical protein
LKERAVLFLIGFEFFIFAHHEKYDRVDIILINENEVIIEVLDITFPYESSYDSKKSKIDKNRDGLISDEELKLIADEDSLSQLARLSLRFNDKSVLLKRVKSEVKECPRQVLKNTPISIWHRFYGKIDEDICGTFIFSDSGDFTKGVTKFIINGKCSIEETNGVVKGNHVIKEMEQKGKSLMIRLSK